MATITFSAGLATFVAALFILFKIDFLTSKFDAYERPAVEEVLKRTFAILLAFTAFFWALLILWGILLT
jgi:hypothetical protein